MDNELIKRISSSIILAPIVFFFIITGSFLFNLFLLICFLITAYEWHMMTKKKIYNIPGLFFLIISFYSIYMIRNNFDGDYIYLLLITIICVATDVGGYVFGNIFKGPKLTNISPNKTYSGMLGGYLFTIIFVNFFLNNSFINFELSPLKNIFIFSVLVSTISQLGDILISHFKRLSKIKDTGKIIPGHGGLLDRIDGMIFAFPFSYFIILINFFEFLK